jgi:nucleolar pre-ribosomal-associated protein 1
MNKIERELEEGESDGQWKKRRNELELEARRRVPDFQVIISLSQKASEETPNKVRTAMLAESSTRLLWLYHLCFPSLVAEVRFDVGKLLQSSFDNEVGTDDIAGPTSGLDTLRRLHVLRLLRESDQFSGFGKSGELCT